MKTMVLLFSFLALSSYSFVLADDGQHITSTGAVFTLDTSRPAFGQAYRDPSDLLWGDVVSLSENQSIKECLRVR